MFVSGDKIRLARKSRGYSQEDIAKAIGRDQSYISKLEKQQIDGGIKGDELLVIAKLLQFDPFAFSDEMTLEEGDLRTRTNDSALSALTRRIDELSARVTPTKDQDPIAERVMVNHALREHVQLVQFLDARMLEKISAMVYGYLQGQRDDDKGNHHGSASA